jgi:hypothetical protein
VSDVDRAVAALQAECDLLADDVTWDLELVAQLLRAAYGAGYIQALTDDPPLSILDACQRATRLRLSIPVN